jgi:hypothetical protein
MMIREYVPIAVEPEVVMPNVELPDPPVTDAGVKVAVAPVGKPLTLKLTVPLNPLIELTVAV